MAILLAALGCHGGDRSPHADGKDPVETGSPTDTAGPEVPSDDGYVEVVRTREGRQAPTAILVGELYHQLDHGVISVDFAHPEGPDTCAVTSYTVEDLAAGREPSLASEDAGPLTLTAPDGTEVVVAPKADLYAAELDPALPFGEPFDVTAPGAAFPAITGELRVPLDRVLAAPVSRFRASGPLLVAWSGGDPDTELTLRLESAATAGPRALILCRITNDGAFEVPASAIEALPRGRVTLHLDQADERIELVEDRVVRLTGRVIDLLSGFRP